MHKTGLTLPRKPLDSNLVSMGVITSAYGIKGWIKAKPYNPDSDLLVFAKKWWISAKSSPEVDTTQPEAYEIAVKKAMRQGQHILAILDGSINRNTAHSLQSRTIYALRKEFPELGEDEYYWTDLIGCAVYSKEKKVSKIIGTVREVLHNNAHPLLKVEKKRTNLTEGKCNIYCVLIPFLSIYVKGINVKQRTILANWPLTSNAF